VEPDTAKTAETQRATGAHAVAAAVPAANRNTIRGLAYIHAMSET